MVLRRKCIKLLIEKTHSFYSLPHILRIITQDRPCTYKHNIEVRSRNHCFCGKPINIKCYAGGSPLLPHLSSVQIGCFPRRMVLSSAACLPLSHLFTLYHKGQDIWGK